MKRFVAGLVGVIALIAFAATSMANHSIPRRGIVHWVDHARNIVVFEDGTRFRVAAGVDLHRLTPGTPVIVYYHPLEGGNLVVSYEHVDPTIVVHPVRPQIGPTVIVPHAGQTVVSPAPGQVVITAQPSPAPTVITSQPGPAIIRPPPGPSVIRPQAGQTIVTSQPSPMVIQQQYGEAVILPQAGQVRVCPSWATSC